MPGPVDRLHCRRRPDRGGGQAATPDQTGAQPASGTTPAERGTEVSPPARAWRPRPTTPDELDDARTVLVVHRLDSRTGRCAACGADCPCPPALDAGRTLAQAGAWNTVPFTGPTGLRVGPGSARARGWRGWVASLVRRLPWRAAAE